MAGVPLLLLLAAGLLLRAIPVLTTDFPLNDGGLFYQMVMDLRDSGLGLPSESTYNDLGIPYSYPPLGLYAAALLTGLTPMGLLDVLRFVPLVVSLATIPITYLVFEQLVSRRRALLATAIFAVIPRGYMWLIAGGGLTRGLGFLFALITIYYAVRVFNGDRGKIWLGGISFGATILSHPQAPLFALVTIAVLVLLRARSRGQAATDALRAGAIASVVALPWLAIVLSQHGVEPFLAAAGGAGEPVSEGLVALISLRWDGSMIPILSVVAAFGIFTCLVNRIWLPPLWLANVVLVDPRAGLTFASLPLALAAAIAIEDMSRLMQRHTSIGAWASGRRAQLALGLAALVVIGSSFSAALDPSNPLHSVTSEQLAAMRWARDHTPPEAEFLVVAGSSWEVDAVAEWFPAMAARRSVATVQGFEWLGGERYAQQLEAYEYLQNCAVTSDLPCVQMWVRDHGPVDYVVLLESELAALHGFECCVAKGTTLLDGLTYSQAYRSAGVAVYEID